MVLPGTMFEEFGFNYIGPIDGHDLDTLVATLENVKALKGPQFLHVITRKGHGYARAEADPILYHGVTRFDPVGRHRTESRRQADATRRSSAIGYATWPTRDPRLVCITPAMREGSGLVRFSKEHPDRYFDVGIAEQHAVTFAGGLACEGMKPVVAIYSTFLQRGYDQLDPRRRAAEPAGAVRDRSRRRRRRRRRDAYRRVRSFVSCAACRTWSSWRLPTRTSAGRCSTPASRSTVRSPFAIRAAADRACRSSRR